MLLRNPFTKALFDARRSLLGWTVAIAAVGAMYASFWPTVDTPAMRESVAGMPQGVREALNYDIATPAGYLEGSVYGLLVALLVTVFALGFGTRMVAGDEEAGTLDLLLAHPVSRTRAALQRFAAFGTGLVVISTMLWVVMLALTGPAKLDSISIGEFAAAHLQLVLFGACFGALAFAIGAATGRRALTLGSSAAVAVVAYLANGAIPQVQGLEWTRNLSPFHWYLGGKPLQNGLDAGGSLLLVAVTAVLVAIGTWAFTRRDIAV